MQGREDWVTHERCARYVTFANYSSPCGVCHWRCLDAESHTLFARDGVVLCMMTVTTPGNENSLS